MIINPDFLLNQIYPIGSLYITTNSINPSNFLGGSWEQITSDAYLKIVDNNAGTLGGTNSQHKIPVSSLPKHRHGNRVTLNMTQGAGADRNLVVGGGSVWSATDTYQNQYIGEDKPYYPYYYGIYVFKRTA